MDKIENEFKGVVALTKGDFETLSTAGTLTINGVTLTYDPLTTLYTIPDEPVIIDSELKADSENAVQNKVVAAKFNDLDTRLTTAESNIETINTDITNINSTLTDLEGVTAEKIEELSQTVNTNTNTISGHSSSIENLQNTLDSIDQTVTNIINSMLPTVVDLTSAIEQLNSDSEGDIQ